MRRSFSDLSRRLLHKGMAQMSDGRDTCWVCHRTPLVGERVHLYGDGTRCCSLCVGTRRELPERSELVHHSEWGHAVKPVARTEVPVSAFRARDLRGAPSLPVKPA
jgi:hypothetical protein